MKHRPEFFEGAAGAYTDCADLIDHLAASLPPEVAFAAPALKTLAAGIREKIDNIDFLLNQEKGCA